MKRGSVAILVMTALAGCGGSSGTSRSAATTTATDPATELRQLYTEFDAAIAQKSGPSACALFTAHGRMQFDALENGPIGDAPPTHKSCEQLVSDGAILSGNHLDAAVTVTGDRATGKVCCTIAAPITFARVGGQWRIDSLGPFE